MSQVLADGDFVLIYDSRVSPAEKFLDDLTPYLSNRRLGWRQSLKKLDIRTDSAAVERLMEMYGRETKERSYPVLVALHSNFDFSREVEIWSPEWLAEVKSRVIQDACYPISSGWWSVEGDWHPTIQKVRKHLLKSPNHTGGNFQEEWINLLKFNELQSLHSDHHREMIGEGTVAWVNVNAECPAP